MKSKHYSDEEILNEVLLNNKEVLFFLYEHNFESLNKKVTSEGGSRKDTEDAFHDALIILYIKIKEGSLKLTCSVHTYLQAVARNIWKQKVTSDLTKFTRLYEDLNDISDDLEIDEENIQVERRKLYLRHLSEMPQDCKRLIKMILEELSLQEIAKQMPYNSVEFTKTKRFRCKVMLVKKIIHDPLYKILRNERLRTSGSIPRW